MLTKKKEVGNIKRSINTFFETLLGKSISISLLKMNNANKNNMLTNKRLAITLVLNSLIRIGNSGKNLA